MMNNSVVTVVEAAMAGECWVGIDVAKAHLDVATWPVVERLRIGRDEAGLAQLVAWLQARPPNLIVLEATGGLEVPVVAALVEARLPTAVINPRPPGISPRPSGDWPRRTRWMRRCWPALARRSARNPDPGKTRMPRN